MKFTKALDVYDSPDFNIVVKHEIQQLDPLLLPLQQGLAHSNYVADSAFDVTILKVTDEAEEIKVKAGIFYTGIIAGCSCSDDPSPVDEQNEYCEVQFDINKKSAEASVTLLIN